MVAGDIARVLRAPGRLVSDPNNLSAAYPYGGTALGKTKLVTLLPLGETFRVMSEGLGEPTDILEASNEYVFSCFLRGWDDDALAQMFGGNYSAGAKTGHGVFYEPGTTTPGGSALTRASIFLYVPDDPVHVPAVLIYNGVPDFSSGAELAFQRSEELGLPVAIECLRDANGNILQVGLLADLSLAP